MRYEIDICRLVKQPLYTVYERRMLRRLDRKALPHHIGVIHDGHRRYACTEGLPDYAASYRVGMAKFIEFLHWTDELGIAAVSAGCCPRRTCSARPPSWSLTTTS